MLTALRIDTSLTDVLRESFTHEAIDGYWYPMDAGEPLVRVYVGGNGYMVERRRNVGSAWLPVVTAEFADFDPDAFRVWRAAYRMTA